MAGILARRPQDLMPAKTLPNIKHLNNMQFGEGHAA